MITLLFELQTYSFLLVLHPLIAVLNYCIQYELKLWVNAANGASKQRLFSRAAKKMRSSVLGAPPGDGRYDIDTSEYRQSCADTSVLWSDIRQAPKKRIRQNRRYIEISMCFTTDTPIYDTSCWPSLVPPTSRRSLGGMVERIHCKTRTVESTEKSFEYSRVCGTSRIEGFFPSNRR